ncbi:hypothetical protein SGFS_056910 [Streptomyces graminofaciens]|uniref:Uncharacterized protein n=1 Tax=Streptomyces graminofaciens TaxID=68212 RepID=A0ABM7FE00_9ACTN|nr:hypothetical protein [Streptomyces graminofaciens]BBC34397.1 hypothetical protein SGFS_056910 [Streptomyces graminofaciens]
MRAFIARLCEVLVLARRRRRATAAAIQPPTPVPDPAPLFYRTLVLHHLDARPRGSSKAIVRPCLFTSAELRAHGMTEIMAEVPK